MCVLKITRVPLMQARLGPLYSAAAFAPGPAVSDAGHGLLKTLQDRRVE